MEHGGRVQSEKKKKKRKEKKKEHPYKMEDYHVAFFEKENHLVWSLISYLTVFFQNLNNEVLSNYQFGWREIEGEYKVK